MGKGTEPPKCKICGTQHWGTCLDHSAKGALFDRSHQAEASADPGKSEVVAAKLKGSTGEASSGSLRGVTPSSPPAGTQAPSVEPLQVEMIASVDVMQDGSMVITDHQSVEQAIAKLKRGRPKKITDMKAYKAEKAKKYRAEKAQKE